MIEFFFCPVPGKGGYFQYAANVSGFTAALRYDPTGVRIRDFKSGSRIRASAFPDRWEAEFVIPRAEIGLDGDIDGRIATANFTRSGNSGGGSSTWAPVGRAFHTPAKFRQVVFGSYRAALLKQLAASRAEFDRIDGKAELKRSIAAELDALEKAIREKGDKEEFFAGLSAAVARMTVRFTQLKFSGRTALIWKPDFIWGNDIAVSPLAKPLEKISVVLPRNSFTYVGFVFSNLNDKPFLGQLKCFTKERFDAKKVYNDFNSYVGNRVKNDRSPIYKNVRFFEALPVISGGPIYDPLLPLPMNTLVRAGAGESKQLWMRFSSEDFPVGKHSFVMVLKPSYPGFSPVEVPVELEVKPVDLGTVRLDSVHSTFVNSNFMHSGGANENLIRFLAEEGINIIYSGAALGSGALDVYPETDKAGNVIAYADYSMWDKLIDTYVKYGIAKERIKLVLYMELPEFSLQRFGVKKSRNVKFGTPEWKKAFRSWILHFTGYMEAKHGITKERIVFFTVDEPSGDISDKSSRMYKAYLSGKLIKEIDKDFRTMVDPHPYWLRGKDLSALEKLAEVHDIIKFYRPGVEARHVKLAKKLGREIWTYGIYQKVDPPVTYRREYWQSLRDGFSPVVNYWHLDSHAGGDGFNSEDGGKSRADYGSTFMDMNMGTVLSSRREEAHLLGREDYRLAEFCRRLLKRKPDPAMQKELDRIIARGASADMEGMETCRLQLLDLAEKLQKKQ